MRKFPRPSHTEPLIDDTTTSLLLGITTAVCPPLGILGFLCCGLFESVKDSADARRYRQSDDYKRYQELYHRIFDKK